MRVGQDVGGRCVRRSIMLIQQLRCDNHIAKLFQESFIVTSSDAGIQGVLLEYVISRRRATGKVNMMPNIPCKHRRAEGEGHDDGKI